MLPTFAKLTNDQNLLQKYGIEFTKNDFEDLSSFLNTCSDLKESDLIFKHQIEHVFPEILERETVYEIVRDLFQFHNHENKYGSKHPDFVILPHCLSTFVNLVNLTSSPGLSGFSELNRRKYHRKDEKLQVPCFDYVRTCESCCGRGA